jgi:carboxyl-terminal processing protease
VVRPFEGGPAFNAGLKKGDVFVKIADIDVAGMDINEAVTHMKGPAGTDVVVTIRRGEELITFTLTRATIEVPTVEYEMLANNIGYIQVTEFDEVTVSQFANAMKDLQKQGMEAIVIDLRDNPGGLVNTAVSMIDRIVPTGVAVYTQDRYGNKDYAYATTAAELNIPCCVLVNGNSASASEIFCGALRDYNKAKIVGTTTYGKGIVQVIQYLSDGSGLKYTISEYFTPGGYAVHGVGIVPDIEVELDEELKTLSEIPKDKDNQLQTAVKELLKQLGK